MAGVECCQEILPVWHRLYNLSNESRRIFEASEGGDVDSLRLLLNHSSNSSQLLLQRDRMGNTALHCAMNRETAQILVESVRSTTLKEFLWMSDELFHRTALQVAVETNKADIVEYLCSLTSDDESLLDGHLFLGHTPLHEARSVHIARILVESVSSDELTTLLLHTDGRCRTALLAAVSEGCDEVVDYLCGISTQQILQHHDKKANTTLHWACTKKSVQLLVEPLPESMRRYLMHMRNNEEATALHTMVQERYNNPSPVEYFLNTVPNANEFLYVQDIYGRTALHYARMGAMANLILEEAHDKLALINIQDNEGSTAVMYMTERGAVDALQSTLECVDIEEVTAALLMTNKKRQNIFHLACISPLVEEFFAVLEEYFDYMKTEDLFTADIYNNTPFTYLIARFCTRIFAQFILKVPFHQRKSLLLQRNYKGSSCLSISEQKQFSSNFYMKRVLCSSEDVSHGMLFIQSILSNITNESLLPYIHSPDSHIRYDENLYKVMLYALNVYSMQELHFCGHIQEDAEASLVQIYHIEKTDINAKKALPPPTLLYFDLDQKSVEEIQRKLYELDVPDRHSGLKVIVVRCSTSDQVRYVSPPGPDFIVITLVPVHSDCDVLLDLQTESFKDVEDLLGYLKNKEGVKYINISSTMAKNYGKPHSRQAEDVMLLSGASKGKALIIHNRADREKWEIEHEHVCHVLGEQLGLQVECLYDKSADDMLTAISEFSKSSGHGSLTALSIMSHGDLRGNICGDGGKGLCSVQQVVDAFCLADIQSVTKLVFLNFCRGPINNPVNRTYNSWECTDLKDIAQQFTFNPIKGHVSQDRLDSVRESHPFPSVDVPMNCYLCYSTLPDTKSLLYNPRTKQANKMFDCLSAHLTDIYKYSTLYKRVDSTHTLSYTTDSEPNDEVVDENYLEMVVSSSEQDVAVSAQQQLPTVELIPLLIDVTGIVREKSGFTQYMNLCYAIDKHSKPLVVEISPANKQ